MRKTTSALPVSDRPADQRRQFLLRAIGMIGGATLAGCGGAKDLLPSSIANLLKPAATTPPSAVTPAAGDALPAPATVPVKAEPAPANVPGWVPPAGFFADIPMKNTPFDVTPAIYRPGDMSLSYDDWGGSAILKDFSPLGAQVMYSSGHEAATGLPNVQLALICDFSTLLYSVSNLPVAANPGNLAAVPSGDFADGTPYSGHSYLGLQEYPAAWGGGPKGSLMAFAIAGSPYLDRARNLDVSRKTGGYGFIDRTTIGGISNKVGALVPDTSTYPTTAIDYKRQGWWLDSFLQTRQSTIFLSRTGAVTLIPAVHGNMADGCIVLCNSLDLLVAASGGYMSGTYANASSRTLRIRNLASGALFTVDTQGTFPSLSVGYDSSPGAPQVYLATSQLGLQWVDSLGLMVGFDAGASPPRVVTLRPSANPVVDPWTWGFVSLKHWDQGDSNGNPALVAPERNNIWSRFRYVDALGAFVLASDSHHKPQVLKLA